MTESLFFHLVYSQYLLGWTVSKPSDGDPVARSDALSPLHCCHGYRDKPKVETWGEGFIGACGC